MYHSRIGVLLTLLAVTPAFGQTNATKDKPSPKKESQPRREAPKPDKDTAGIDTAGEDLSAEEEQQRKVVERFLSVLDKNPRRGTALDRVYGYHVERGSLEQLVEDYRKRIEKNSKDGAAWMVLGLIEAQRGQDAAAVAAFQEAEKRQPTSALASYYLGQALVLVGQPDAAALAFERAIDRKPAPADVLDVFQALGRVHQRAQRHEQALAVWERFEKLFPGDARVQEQIATILAEEGRHDQALPRYVKLAKATKDPYRKSLFQMEAAETRLRLGQKPQALADFEALLSELNPDSWLHREVRRRIEEAFLRSDDQAGLARYYEGWVTEHAQDVDAMARLARTLVTQGRVPEAQKWLDKAIKLAPTRKELRLTFIEQLVYDQKYADAIAQYEALDKAEPNNPDYLREWGKLILKDGSRGEVERQQAAAAVWKRLLDARPKDPLIATQVADLLRQAGMTDEALSLYQRAIELAPDAPQYREYLGEYYHNLKRQEEALATWREIAAGPKRDAKNLARLAEVLSGFGYLKEAVETMAAACKLENDDFALRLQFAQLLGQDTRYDDALSELAAAEKLATNEEETEAVLLQQLKNFEAGEQLQARIAQLSKELEAGQDVTARRWYLLARYHEAARALAEAAVAAHKSLELDEASVPVLAAQARISESAGNLLAAAEAYRRLAAVDRRSRTTYLTEVAKLEARLGRREQALAAGRDLLAAAPGNPESYEFFAGLCFQLGEDEEGLEALRRSLRVNPSDPQVVLSLARALADRFRTDEAIELYWRAFEKATELEARRDVVTQLANLYLQTNHFERLVERLDRQRREAEASRDLTVCLAQAYHAAGDFGTAAQELERLLAQDPNDTQLLQQLSSLAEAEGDIATAAKYQRQLVHLAPGKEPETRLAQLLVRAGDSDEASAIWIKLTIKDEDPEHIFRAIDSLLSSGKPDSVLAVTERILRKEPGNWEALYREGLALAANKPDEAAKRFQALLDVHLSDDEPSTQTKAQRNRPIGRQVGAMSRQAVLRNSVPIQQRMQAASQVRYAAGLEMRNYYGQQQFTWAPADFGQARTAALAWLLNLAQKQNQQDEFLARQRQSRDEAIGGNNADRADRARWDWFYLQLVRNEPTDTYEAAKAFATSADPLGQWIYLSSLGNRVPAAQVVQGVGVVIGAQPQRVARQQAPDEADSIPPLSDAELEQVLGCYREVRRKRPEILTSYGYGGAALNNVLAELKRAKRTDEELRLYREAVGAAEQQADISTMMQLAAARDDFEGLGELWERFERAGEKQKGTAYNPYVQPPTNTLAQAMGALADSKAYADVLKLFDRYLDYHIRHRKSARPATARRANNPNAGRQYYQVWLGKQLRQVQIDFPQPNDYFDSGAIMLLRNVFEIYKRDDLVSDLLDHFQTQLAAAPEADRVYQHLGLGYLRWWNEEPEEAIAELRRASKAAPADMELTLEVAGVLENHGDLDDALALADSLTPLDHTTMQRRETLALRLAVRAGDVERARQAAERLFGLRLDAETQVQLAAQMRQLGMHEQAEAVLARAQRQAGNRTGALVSLMLQYQGQNQPEVAAQVAYQILRRAPARQRQPNMGTTEADAARDQALQVLSRLGKLQELIARAEAQLKNSPNSVQIYQTLAEYQQAAGDRKKSAELYEQMARLRPDDPALRYQVAEQLANSGQYPAALEHYRAAIKKEPALFARNYSRVQQAFRQAKKLDELAALLDEVDLRSLGNYSAATNIVQILLQDQTTQEAGLRIFRKAWQAFPEQRATLMSRLYNDQLWQLPEIYDYGRQALIPNGAVALANPWAGIDNITSYSQDGKVTGVLTRMLEVAAKQGKLDDLAKEAEQALVKVPGWIGGKALIAVLRVRLGKVEEGRKMIEELLADKRHPVPLYASWIVGQELEGSSELESLAIRLYESTIDGADARINLQFANSPIKRLVTIYHKAGRDADARALILKLAAKTKDVNNDPSYAAYSRIQNLSAIGQQLIDLGYPLDAARMFNDLLADQSTFELAQNVISAPNDYFKQQAQQGLARAMGGLKPETLGATLDALLKPAATVSSDRSPIDLLVLVQPQELSKTSMTSMLATVLRSAADIPELKARARASLAVLVVEHPDDLRVQIAAAMAALVAAEGDEIAATTARLEALVDKAPLEVLPAGGRANSRQRAAAVPQIDLWLVARDCLKDESLRSRGEKLAERALEAARRQTDLQYVLAILREWGQIDLDAGDRNSAERRWSQMLELVLPKPGKSKVKS